jgi:phosphohistidine phosphatase
MKLLYLLRHAKSSWDDPALADHDRPLAGRGRKAGAAMSRHLAQNGVTPQLVLCSTAKRTRQTLDLLGDAVAEAEVAYENELYGASAEEVLARLHEIPDTVASVLVIGHNPAMQALALQLAASSDTRDLVADKYPTGALAVLQWEGEWHALRPGGAQLTEFVRPRDLP